MLGYTLQASAFIFCQLLSTELLDEFMKDADVVVHNASFTPTTLANPENGEQEVMEEAGGRKNQQKMKGVGMSVWPPC